MPPRAMTRRIRLLLTVLFALLGIGVVSWFDAAGWVRAARRPRARLIEQHPWHGQGIWLQGDPHTHYLLSGRKGPEMARAASRTGLDFVASTDHAEGADRPTRPLQMAARRMRHPELIVLAGIEWNVPGADHFTVLVEDSPDEFETLLQFTRRFDRKVNPELTRLDPRIEDRTWGSLDQALDGLNWLKRQRREDGPRTVVMLNHPGKRNQPSLDWIGDLQAAGLASVAAAPGKQNKPTPGGSYVIERHEPFVARVGGEYDQLLSRGVYLGLFVGSDFHGKKSAYLPGVFSRTLVYSPGRSSRGVIAGLDAGCTATVLGGVVSAVETRMTAAGFDDHAMIGEALGVARGSTVTYSVLATVPELDFEERPNRLDRVEIISNCTGEVAVVKTFEGLPLGQVRLDYELPRQATKRRGRCFLRARGQRFVGGPGPEAQNADYLFYTGATFVEVLP